jgi:DNA polymerase III subunit beta
MNVTCLLESYKSALIKVEKLVAKNLSLPVLGFVYMHAEGDTITLEANNLNSGISITLPAQVHTPGTCTLSGGVLLQILNNIKEKNITFILEDHHLHIKSQKVPLKLKSHSEEDFPRLPRLQSSEVISIDSEVILDALRSVAFAASSSDIKPEISSVFMYTENHFLYCVATDAFRLAEKKKKITESFEIPGIIIPIKSVQEIIRLLQEIHGTISLILHEHQLSLEWNEGFYTSRIVDGSFPDYKRIIPTETVTSVTALREDIITCIKMSTIFADTFHQLEFSVDPEKKECYFQSKNQDIGEQKSYLEGVLEGNPVQMYINHRYLHDVFQVLGTDSIHCSIVSSAKPLVITGVGDSSFLYLIMPIHRNN